MGVVLPTPSDGSSPEIRISDADRERVIGLLKTSCGEGRLTLDEFSERCGATWAAQTAGDLGLVLADLPHSFGPEPTGAVAIPGQAPVPSGPRPVFTDQSTRWTVAVLSGSRRKGRWRLRHQTNAVALMGGCELDLRQAEVEGPEVVINAWAIMGGVDVIVPEGIAVELTGFGIMGGKDAKIKNVPVLPGSPVVRVRAFALMGGVTVRSRPLKPEGRPRSSPRQSRLPGGITDAVASGLDTPVRELASAAAPDGTVTIMFTDIEGFTPLVERLGDQRANSLLQEHNDLIRREIDSVGGFEVKAQGDGFMVAFAGANRALRCAVRIEQAFDQWTSSHPDTPIRVRIGLHTGEVIRERDDFVGGAVTLAARITKEAQGREILVSSVLKELCAHSGEFQFSDGRPVLLKGFSEPRNVYSVLWDGTR
jgi:class 3 adenylate cyclase